MKKNNILSALGLISSGKLLLNRNKTNLLSGKSDLDKSLSKESFSTSDVYKMNINNVVTIISKKPNENEENNFSEGIGTGIIIKNNNKYYILTNNHVIMEATNVNVLIDNTIQNVNIIGTSSEIDLAVLELKNYTPKKFSTKLVDEKYIMEGEIAIAIGSPYRLTGTVTQGIISSLNRNVTGSGMVYIQTDAAINPGNSGGPLFNNRGEVIGLNTFIVQNTVGLGFAIPSSIVIKATNEIIENGIFKKNYIGIVAEDIYSKGIVVKQILKYGPSYNKLLKNDIILEFDGKKIYDMSSFKNKIIYNSNYGTPYDVKINRNGEDKIIQIMLETKNDVIKDLGNIVVEPVSYNIIKNQFNEVREAVRILDNKNNFILKKNDIILKINDNNFNSIDKTLEDIEGKESLKGLLRNSEKNIKLSIFRKDKLININYTNNNTKSLKTNNEEFF